MQKTAVNVVIGTHTPIAPPEPVHAFGTYLVYESVDSGVEYQGILAQTVAGKCTIVNLMNGNRFTEIPVPGMGFTKKELEHHFNIKIKAIAKQVNIEYKL